MRQGAKIRLPRRPPPPCCMQPSSATPPFAPPSHQKTAETGRPQAAPGTLCAVMDPSRQRGSGPRQILQSCPFWQTWTCCHSIKHAQVPLKKALRRFVCHLAWPLTEALCYHPRASASAQRMIDVCRPDHTGRAEPVSLKGTRAMETFMRDEAAVTAP